MRNVRSSTWCSPTHGVDISNPHRPEDPLRELRALVPSHLGGPMFRLSPRIQQALDGYSLVRFSVFAYDNVHRVGVDAFPP
jgi:hypothetical protein